MPTIQPNIELTIRRTIRDAYALDPLLDSKKLMDHLEKRFNRTFAWRYIEKLKKKVLTEATPAMDREKVETRLRHTRELMRIGKENLLTIAYGTGTGMSAPDYKDRVAAWRAIAFLEKLLIETELDLGLYRQAADANPDAFRFRPIPQDVREGIVATFRTWQLPPGVTRRIEPSALMEAESRYVPPKAPVEAPGTTQAAETTNNGPTTGVQPDAELQLH